MAAISNVTVWVLCQPASGHRRRTADLSQDFRVGRRVELRDRDFLAPREVRRSCQDESQRKYHQSKRRGIEDVRAPSLLVPPDQLFCREAEGQHHELKLEPIRLEPEEKVRAENNWKRKKTQRVGRIRISSKVGRLSDVT